MQEIAELHDPERVAILLSVFNGGHFLPEQPDSLLTRTHRCWQLCWRDDGSEDRSTALLRALSAGPAKGRVTEIAEPSGRLGALRSFLTLLAAAEPHGAIAFADQDDVWRPEKLTHGLAALGTAPAQAPGLDCARQIMVDANRS